MSVIMAGMDHMTVWRFTGAVLGQGLLHARWCAMSGVMVQTVQKTVWRFHRCCSSSRSSTLPFVAQWQFPMVQTTIAEEIITVLTRLQAYCFGINLKTVTPVISPSGDFLELI